MKFPGFLISILLSVILCSTVYGQSGMDSTVVFDPEDRTERIINFHSDIVIDTTDRIQVTEHIFIFSNGNEIKRGIIREIPIYRENKNGKKIKTDVNVLSVLRNGENEEYRVERSGDNKAIYIGNKDILLNPGIHKYTITYESYKQIGFFDQFDELYWNVTGNNWEFYIENASASFTLPEGASYLEPSCYTGKYASTQSECTMEEKDNRLIFRTNDPLAIHEGFTVVITFPKGIVKATPPTTLVNEFRDYYKILTYAAIGLVIFLIYFIITWIKAGKDPQKPVVIPLFEPPYGWSPAVTRYLYAKGYDEKVLSVTLINMAIKGAIRIHRNPAQEYHLEKIGNREKLTPEELAVFDLLFEKNDTLTLSDKNYKIFEKTNSTLKKNIRSQRNIKDYFHKNTAYIVFGFIIMIAILITLGILTGTIAEVLVSLFPVPFLIMGLFFIAAGKKALSGDISGIVPLIFGCIITGVILLMEFFIIFQIDRIISVYVILMGVIFFIYCRLIKAPTQLGSQTLSELEGFRMYLRTTEEDRFNRLMPPEKTPELFEKLYPYAIALDVPNEWSKKFNQELQSIDYKPNWYVSNQPFVLSSFTRSFGSSLTQSTTAPSSSGNNWSSGSSGGGFSGGGGGGGGGRGW